MYIKFSNFSLFCSFKIIKVITLLFSIAYLFCSLSDKKPLNELEFNVNDSLLQKEEIIDTLLKISFRPPENWKKSPNVIEDLILKLNPNNQSAGELNLYI